MANVLSFFFANAKTSYSDTMMIASLVISLLIGILSILLVHIPLKLIIFFCNRRVQSYSRGVKRMEAKHEKFKTKIVSRVYHTTLSIWCMFWLLLAPLTLLTMFNRLHIAASIFIQMGVWIVVLLHFGVRSNYKATKATKLTNRIKSLDSGLGRESTEPFRGYKLGDEDDEDDDDEEFEEYDAGALHRKTKLDLAEEHDLKITSRYSLGNPKWRQAFQSVMYYPLDILIGIKKHYIIFAIAMTVSIIVPLVLVLTTCATCVTAHPTQISSAFTRRIAPGSLVADSRAICKWNSICHSYLTVPKDMSTSMIVNFHTYSRKPSDAHVLVTKISEDGEILSEPSKFSATSFRMKNIPFQERYQYWADLTDLEPSTIYLVETIVIVKGKKLTQQTLKFRTGPSSTTTTTTEAESNNETIDFVSGGDMEWTRAGISLTRAAANSNPLFAIVGGDIGYENGFSACYARMDEWFYNWNKYMTTPDNFTVPILTAIGNHEAGGFKQPRSNVGFYFSYFPHQIGLQDVSPQDRSPYHEHVFGKNTFIVVLDSYAVTPIGGKQTEWLTNVLASELKPDHTNRFAVYHASAYPIIDKELKEITQPIRKLWVPLFEQYNFKAVFENHYHALQETHPIRANAVNETGVRYLGSGAWGLSPRTGLNSQAWWVDKSGSLCHIYAASCEAVGCNVRSIIYDNAHSNTTTFSTLLL